MPSGGGVCSARPRGPLRMSLPPLSELRAVCQAPVRAAAHRHDPLYRAMSIHVTRVMVWLGVSAHAVTVVSLGLGLAAAGLLLEPTGPRLIGAMLCLQGYLLLDYVDGEVARWSRTASLGGRFLEQVGANAVDPFILAATGVGLALPASAYLGTIGAISQLIFRSLPAALVLVVVAVGLRRAGEATPAPAPEPAPVPDRDPPGWSYGLYRRFRFPFFHPNFVLLMSLACAADVLGSWAGRGGARGR